MSFSPRMKTASISGNLTRWSPSPSGAPFDGSETEPKQWVSVRIIKVVIRGDVEGTGEAGEYLKNVFPVAEGAATEFVDRVRLLGQVWLGMRGEPQPLAGSGNVFNDESGERIKISYGGVISVKLPTPDLALTDAGLSRLQEASAKQEPQPLPEVLLADALHIATMDRPDFGRAILIAAVACEAKVKATLTTKVFAAGRPLVDVLLSNPRDYSMRAVSLFDTAMKAAVGRSLKGDDPKLYKLIEKLIEYRNAVAHTGKEPPKVEPRLLLSAACAPLVKEHDITSLPCPLLQVGQRRPAQPAAPPRRGLSSRQVWPAATC